MQYTTRKYLILSVTLNDDCDELALDLVDWEEGLEQAERVIAF